jgi:hypothetical protein
MSNKLFLRKNEITLKQFKGWKIVIDKDWSYLRANSNYELSQNSNRKVYIEELDFEVHLSWLFRDYLF